MLKLQPNAEPFWLDIVPSYERKNEKGETVDTVPAQRTRFRPPTTAMTLAAREEASRAKRAATPQALRDATAMAVAAEKPLEALAEITEDPANHAALSLAAAEAEVAFARTMARLAIVEWEGIVGPDDAPAPVTPENVAAYLNNWDIYDAVNALYVMPSIARIDEKNAFAPSPNGTSPSEEGAVTAKTAKPFADANAKSVPTKRKRRKRSTASKPGKSSSDSTGSSASRTSPAPS